MLLYSILVYTIHGKIQKNHNMNNKFIISVPTWHDEFELLEF